MENQMQAMDDRQAEVGNEKKPYDTPRLKKLGSVEQLTQGMALAPMPDDGFLSV